MLLGGRIAKESPAKVGKSLSVFSSTLLQHHFVFGGRSNGKCRSDYLTGSHSARGTTARTLRSEEESTELLVEQQSDQTENTQYLRLLQWFLPISL